MNKLQKKEFGAEIASNLKDSSGLVLADFKGLSVHQLETLRKKVEAEGGQAQIIKNTILEKVFEKNNIKGMDSYLKLNTIMFYAKDDVMRILKPLAEYAKENDKFILKGGFLDGQAFDKAGVIEMSKLGCIELRWHLE